jgi:integrase
MVYSFARVGAVLQMQVCDNYPNGERWWVKLHEKGGKFHEVPVHHVAEEYLDAYLEVAGIKSAPRTPLFRSVQGRKGVLTERPMSSVDALEAQECWLALVASGRSLAASLRLARRLKR